MKLREATDQFLASQRIAVHRGVPRPEGHGGNIVYQRPKEPGYEAFGVNPNAPTVDGD